MAKKQICFLDLTFESKKDFINYVEGLIPSLNGETISKEHPSFKYLEALLRRHYYFGLKLEELNIVGFRIKRSRGNLGYDVSFISTNEGEIVFSWRKCIEGKPLLERNARNIIRQQILDYRAGVKQICSSCETTIGPFEVDHTVSFASLFSEYQKDFGEDLSSWWAYHSVHAKLTLLCKDKCHKLKTKETNRGNTNRVD